MTNPPVRLFLWLFNLLKVALRRQKRRRKLLVLALTWICLLLLLRLYVTKHIEPPLLIWWTNQTGLYGEWTKTSTCGPHKCIITTLHDQLTEAAAILFHAQDLVALDMPVWQPKSVWALLYEGSPLSAPFVPFERVLQHFNFTSTFSRHSDFPVTMQHLPHVQYLVDTTFLVPVAQKSILRDPGHLAAVAFIESVCESITARDEYVFQLMEHIPIDSYGECLHNTDLPQSEESDMPIHSHELLQFLGKYKFILGYEDGSCDDYITERFWLPLVVGAVPIYYGSPTIRDWEPNKKSAIYISDFESPAALADFLLQLDENDTEYNTYLKHKYDPVEPISNKRLQQQFIGKAVEEDTDVLDNFECAVCGKMFNMPTQVPHAATLAHYNCVLPMSSPPMQFETTGVPWDATMETGKEIAEIVHWMLMEGKQMSVFD